MCMHTTLNGIPSQILLLTKSFNIKIVGGGWVVC